MPQSRPFLYLISNRQAFRRSPDITELESWQLQIEVIREAAQAGCQLVQIRERDLSARDLCNFTRAAIGAARPHGAKILVNDRLDVAITAGADGVHLRVSSLPASEVRSIVSGRGLRDFLIGVSTHSLAEAQRAESSDADFIVCGPVFATPSKSSFGSPLGKERFAEICRSVKIPALALGGINLSNFRELLRSGAAGIAAIGLFIDRENLKLNIETIITS
ncbi:MAG: thiamine phosphate synthase [Acidobacteria bacterium]|nr:thiamine phosphate synthase [Acidobacteriota bacterium]